MAPFAQQNCQSVSKLIRRSPVQQRYRHLLWSPFQRVCWIPIQFNIRLLTVIQHIQIAHVENSSNSSLVRAISSFWFHLSGYFMSMCTLLSFPVWLIVRFIRGDAFYFIHNDQTTYVQCSLLLHSAKCVEKVAHFDAHGFLLLFLRKNSQLAHTDPKFETTC